MSIIPWWSDQTVQVLMAYARGAGASSCFVAEAWAKKSVKATHTFFGACEWIDKEARR